MVNMTALRAALVCSLLYGCSEAQKNENKALKAETLAATDARDAENPSFVRALNQGDWTVLPLLGQIGSAGCDKLVPFLSHEQADVRSKAIGGAAYCYGDKVTGALIAQLPLAVSEAEHNKMLVSLGFSDNEAVTPILLENFSPTNTASVYALLQNIVYKRLPANELSDLPFDAILEAVSKPEIGFVNAYFLTRLQGLNEVFKAADVFEATLQLENQHTQKLMVRIMPQFGEVASIPLLAIAKGEPGPAQIEAIRAMGQLSDAESKAYLLSVLDDNDSILKGLALTALAGRDKDDAALTKRIIDMMALPDSGLVATALAAAAERAPDDTRILAESFLASDNYYLANKAIGILSQSEEGKTVLTQFAEANANSQRGRDARIALDPSAVDGGADRPSPAPEMLRSYADKRLQLRTSRGDIVISMKKEAPYSAVNFLQLAESGKMDGMLWHRVIPNFVAQAGQIEDLSINDWGNIREEWFASDHQIGTVGLATIGKDTGSTQFFINTAYNLHLNGRYTVFGEVTEGLDVVMALREGDVIEKAEVLAAN